MRHECPVCGGHLAGVPITIFKERGIAVGNGRCVDLTGSEMRLLTALADRFPDVVTKEGIMDALYFDQIDDEPEIKIVDVFVCKVRKKVEALGLTINTAWGLGYSLGCSARVTE
jgi:DNA-binding response OmpR family regulator